MGAKATCLLRHLTGNRWLLPMSLVCAFVTSSAVEPTAPAHLPAAPYRHLRDTTLEYLGPEEDAESNGEIRIVWFGPTEVTNVLGADLWWSANFAVNQANAALPTVALPNQSSLEAKAHLLPCRLIPCWSGNPWGAGVAQLARMVYEQRPLAVIGSIDSASTHLAEQIVAKANLPLVSPIATDKSVTLAGVSWTFACAPSDSAVARVLVDGVLSTLPNRTDRLALLATTDHESRMTAREVLQEFNRRQRPPDFRFDVLPGSTENSQSLAALAEAHPAAILIVAGAEDSARLAQTIQRVCASHPGSEPSQSTGPRLFGCQSMARSRFRDLAGPMAEQVSFPLIGTACATNSTAALFVERFTSDRGYPPDYAALLAYDATRLLLEAIQQAGPHRAQVRNVLAHLSPWPGLAGTIAFDGTGQNTRTNVQLATWRGGRIELLGSPPLVDPSHLTLYE